MNENLAFKIYKGRSVLITGHTGFKGSWLALWLTRLGAKVTGYSLDLPTSPSLFEILDLSRAIASDRRGNVGSFEKLKKVCDESQPEIIFHLAGQSIVSEGIKFPKETFDTNIGGTVNLLECIRHCHSVKAAVIVTSDKCYENFDNDEVFTEESSLGGREPYGASKSCAEIVTHAYCRSFFHSGNVRLASARSGNTIGGGDWASHRLIPDCVNALINDKPLLLRNPKFVRPWQHVLEPLFGYLILGAALYNGQESARHQAFNFGPDEKQNCPVENIVGKFLEFWPSQKKIEKAEISQNNSESRLLRLSSEKAKKILNWQPTLNLDQAVKWSAQWYKTYLENPLKVKNEVLLNLTAEQIAQFEQLSLASLSAHL